MTAYAPAVARSAFHAAAWRFSNACGAVHGFLKKGLPWTGGRSFYRDAEVFRFAMHQDDEQSLPPMINIAQYQIEQLLLDKVEQHADLIDIRWQTRVTGIEQHTGNGATGATLDLSTGDTAWKMRADWVVACDGGRSTIREALGLKLTGTTYEGRYVIVDIELESERATERLAYFDPPSNPGSTVLVHKQPDNVWRIDYQLRDDEDPEAAIKPENVMPRVQSVLDSMGETGEWSPIWITVYKANALTLERYRHGSVLFAGDAAHLVPIFGVRGANSGIDDADNLGWKLGCVVNGIASDRLLDSYSDERVFAARENLSYGMKSTEFMAPPSFAFDLMRQAVLGLAAHHPAVRPLINPRQTHAIAYVQSPLNRVAAAASGAFARGSGARHRTTGVPTSTHVRRRTRRYPSHRSAWAMLHRTSLRRGHGARRSVAAIAPCARRTRHSVQSDHAGHGRCAARHQSRMWSIRRDACMRCSMPTPGTVYLIRPDGHVLARWRNGNATDVQSAVTASLTN